MLQVSLSKFKKMTAQQLKESPCMEVMADGEHLFIAIVGSVQEMRYSMKGQASQIDAARGINA